MKKVFISHPFHSNPVVNRRKIADICRAIAEAGEVIPISPVHSFSYLDEGKHRQMALDFCLALLDLCDELWLYGEWQNSEGCLKEFVHAWRLNKPICEEHDIQKKIRRKQVALGFIGCLQKMANVKADHLLSPAAERFIGGDKETTREELDSYYDKLGVFE